MRDADGQQLAYVYFENEPGRRSAAKLLTKDEARRIAVKRIAIMLPKFPVDRLLNSLMNCENIPMGTIRWPVAGIYPGHALGLWAATRSYLTMMRFVCC